MHLVLVIAALLAVATPALFNDRWPHYSPDGAKLAFMSTRDGSAQVYVMRADGGSATRVSPPLPPKATYGGVKWLPNGRLLVSVYQPTVGGADDGLAAIQFIAMNVLGGDARILYEGINNERPDLSPTGDVIAFEQEHGPFQTAPNIDVETFDIKTLSTLALTGGGGEYIQAAWSPDGTKIAYACARPKEELQLCVMRSDGSEAHAITRSSGSHQWPAWSPDGKQLAYFLEGIRDGQVDASIAEVGVDGSNDRLITAHSGIRRDETPAWSPDGRSIVFQTDRLGAGFRIAVMSADGGSVRVLR